MKLSYKKTVAIILTAMMVINIPATILAEEDPIEKVSEVFPENDDDNIHLTLGEPPKYLEDFDYSYTAPSENTLEIDPLGIDLSGGFTDSGLDSVSKLSMKELASLYKSVGSYSSLYATKPVVSGSNYSPGVLSDDAIGYAERWINYYRSSVGLPEITLTDEANLEASYGALILAMNNDYLTHTPSKPADASQEDYERGYAATSSSNLSMMWSSAGAESLQTRVLKNAVSGQMEDEDPTNIDRVGHRRWLLNPYVLTMGVGTANSGSSFYTAIKVFGDSVQTTSVTNYDCISWPASGNNLSDTFPVSTPWSISLNPSKYSSPNISEVNVTLESLSTGSTWTFNESTGSDETDAGSSYFTINPENYGYIPNCIIFRPAYLNLNRYSGVYVVTVSGIKTRSGEETSLKYAVVFETAANAETSADFTYLCDSINNLQSNHVYESGSDVRWIYIHPEPAEGLDMTFNEASMLADGDSIVLYNSDGSKIGTYSGSDLAGKIISFEGSSAQIRLISNNGGSYGFAVDKVIKSVPLKAISFETASLNMIKGDTAQLNIIYTPEDTTQDKTATWTSDNEKVLSVDPSGVITGLAKGTAKVTAKVGKFTAECTVGVYPGVEEVTFDLGEIKIFEGQTFNADFAVIPQDAIYKNAFVEQKNAQVVKAELADAAVNIKGLKTGSSTVTLNLDNKLASINVEVRDHTVLHYLDDADTEEQLPVTYGGKFDALSDKVPEKEGYIFGGWYTLPNAKGDKVSPDSTVFNQYDLYAYWINNFAEEMVFEAVLDETPTYTGKALKPSISVYAGGSLLKPGTNYTLKYVNNVSAYTLSETDPGFNPEIAPCVIVTGKGNYAGTAKLYFTIEPVSLSSPVVSISDQWFQYDGQNHRSAPIITFAKKKLIEGKDFECEYESESADAYIKAGEYSVLIHGIGNYSDIGAGRITIYENGINLSKAKISKIPVQTYSGDAVTLNSDMLRVSSVISGKNTTLTPGEHYNVFYMNNSAPGTATVKITGIQGVSYGNAQATFTITGTSIAKATVTGIEDKIFASKPLSQNPMVQLNGVTLNEDTDYTVSYLNNWHVGKATVLITGRGLYTGTVKKTFKITAQDISNPDCDIVYNIAEHVIDGNQGLKDYDMQVKYMKGATTPEVSVKVDNILLTEKTDYTVSYSNNKSITSLSTAKKPKLIIKGKGDYKGQVEKEFNITSKSLDDIVIVLADKPVKDKAGAYKSTPVLYDENGKLLKAGTDYTVKSYKALYPDATTEVLDSKSKITTAGTTVTVTIEGKGAYNAGELRTANYSIKPAEFKNIKVRPISKGFTGSRIMLEETDFYDTDGISRITIGSGTSARPLVYGTDYEIIEGTYENNIRPGSATVLIRGLGDYAGTAKVRFKISGRLIDRIKWLIG